LTEDQIETLPTRSADVQPLQNVLSISTAGKNRYLFHFNSLNSLTQWTAAIRLAMYENASLQEAYTGSLIAGKGKLLNNIKTIMDRTRIRNEDWTRVRFGAGTPWRRCWCVITPPDEKEVQKQQKQLRKKSAYERTAPLQGNIKFYDTRKTKKAQPIATVNDAYSAYAIYPQSKPLIDQSTLIKVEGSITIHSTPETTTEGFVFVMPEAHPAVSGFEMMLRFLFPLYDVFAMYGRPQRLIADTLDPRSLMFALPQEKRYGYLEILDIATVIHEDGSPSWSERVWRKKMKDLTSARMTRMTTNGRPRSRANSYRDYRNSLPGGRHLRYEDGASIKSTPSLRNEPPPMPPPHRSGSAPIVENPTQPPARPRAEHQRSFSESTNPMGTPRHQRSTRTGDQSYTPSRLSHEQTRPSYEGTRSTRQSYEHGPPPTMAFDQAAPPPPAHGVPIAAAARIPQVQRYASEADVTPERSSSESERRASNYADLEAQDIHQDMKPAPPPASVVAPPAFSHEPGAKPQKRPGISPDLRRANSRLSVTTLSQLADAGKNSTVGGGAAAAGAAAAWGRSNSGSLRNGSTSEESGQRGVINAASKSGNNADRSTSAEGLVLARAGYPTSNGQGSRNISATSSQQDFQGTPYYKDKPLMSSYDLHIPSNPASRTVSPLPQTRTPSPPVASSRPALGVPRSYSKSGLSQNSSSSSLLQEPPASVKKPAPVPITPQRPQASRSNTGHSISRKPLPVRTPSVPSEQRATEPVPPAAETPTPAAEPRSDSLEGLQDNYIDEDALAQVLDRQHTQSITSQTQNGIHDDDTSVYDNDSTVSPDYASTRKSTETKRSQRSMDRPRRGVLKTVGTVEPKQPEEIQLGDVHYRPGATPEPVIITDIPTVDFGRTEAYDPSQSSRPNTSGTMTQQLNERSKSSDRLNLTPSPRNESPRNEIPRNESPSENPRAFVAYPSEQLIEPYERAPSRSLTTPEPQIRAPSAADNDKRRSIAWQPGAMFGGGSPGARQSITPEQFVQQRAAAGRVPVYAHGRKTSASPTPPNASRQSSGERPVQQQRNSPGKLQKRQSSYSTDMPARPNSRAASAMMNASEDYTAHLSAREQEHVARATATPLINVAGKRGEPQGGGLVGAIEAREKEKKEMKAGLSGHMVQHAIAQRQQHRQSSYGAPSPQLAASAQQYAAPTPPFTMPGQYPPSPNGYGVSQQQYAMHQPYAQYQQPPQRQFTPPATQLSYGAQQGTYPQQPQQYQQYPQYQQGQYQQGNFMQPSQYGQGQQQYPGSYFGKGQGGR